MNMESGATGGAGRAGHVDLERMLAYAHGESGVDEAAAVLRHGRTCRDCGDQLAVMLALAGSAAASDSPDSEESGDAVAPRRSDVSKHPWLGAVAASIVLAALLVATMTAAWLRAPADDVPTAGVDSPVADIARLATSAPPDELTIAFLFEATQPIAASAEARTGFGMIVAGDYPQAIEYLEPLRSARPDDGETAMALGIALYLNGNDGEQTETLLLQGRALRMQDFSHLAEWYLANLYVRRGDLVQAIAVLEELALERDDPADLAAVLLEQLRSEAR